MKQKVTGVQFSTGHNTPTPPILAENDLYTSFTVHKERTSDLRKVNTKKKKTPVRLSGEDDDATFAIISHCAVTANPRELVMCLPDK